MFSGIVEEMAILRGIEHEQENIHFTFQCSFTKELKIDQSIAHMECALQSFASKTIPIR